MIYARQNDGYSRAIVESRAKWRFVYTRAHFGFDFPGPIENLNWFAEGGPAYVAFGKVEAKPTGSYDDTNLGKPSGMKGGTSGEGAVGIFVGIGATYEISLSNAPAE